jgi:hypothetical protein
MLINNLNQRLIRKDSVPQEVILLNNVNQMEYLQWLEYQDDQDMEVEQIVYC